MAKPSRLFAILLLAGAALAVSAVAGAWLAPEAGREGLRTLLFGRPLLELRSPIRGQIVSEGGVDVHVSFPEAERVAPETFRCLLNGRDVTDELTHGRSGAVGSLVGAIHGENRLRVEVFGHSPWLDRFLEDSREVTFRVRPLPNLDRG